MSVPPAVYRAPRVGDLLAVRSSNPFLTEVQVLITTVADTGGYVLLGGALGDHDLEVVIRRVGATSPRSPHPHSEI